jgi:hypothetical protein
MGGRVPRSSPDAARREEPRVLPAWARPIVAAIAIGVVVAAIVGAVFAGVVAGLAMLVAGGVLVTAVALLLGVARPRSLL